MMKNTEGWGLIRPEPEDVSRLTETLSLIENEWLLMKEGRPMVNEIRAQAIYISR